MDFTFNNIFIPYLFANRLILYDIFIQFQLMKMDVLLYIGNVNGVFAVKKLICDFVKKIKSRYYITEFCQDLCDITILFIFLSCKTMNRLTINCRIDSIHFTFVLQSGIKLDSHINLLKLP